MNKMYTKSIYFLAILGLVITCSLFSTNQANAINYNEPYYRFIGNVNGNTNNYQSGYSNTNNNSGPVWYDDLNNQNQNSNNTNVTNTKTTTNSTVTKKTTNTTTKKVAAKTTAKKDTTSSSNESKLTAGLIWGENSFIPSGFFQWLLFFILLLIAIILWRKVYVNQNTPLKHA